MTNLISELFGARPWLGKPAAGMTQHARRARMMVVAAMLSAFGLVAVASTLLTALV